MIEETTANEPADNKMKETSLFELGLKSVRVLVDCRVSKMRKSPRISTVIMMVTTI